MNKPKVSIIVPIYGVERYIERCAVSLFEQTYKDIEYIFINDATPDQSIGVLQTILARYPDRMKHVKIITHPQNRGVSAARNSGLDAATGEYIWQIDADDYITKNAVQTLAYIAEHHKADIVIFDVNIVESHSIRVDSVRYNNKEDYIRRILQHTEKCAHWNKFYKLDLFTETGVRADERIRLADDYAVTPRLLYCAKQIVMLHEPLYFYETTNQSSYVHNLNHTAIESQYIADKILVDYFTSIPDAMAYADVVSALPQRSLVSLIKNADDTCWDDILDVYKDELSHSGRQMTMVNRVIFHLAKNRRMHLLKLFMDLYHLVMRYKLR